MGVGSRLDGESGGRWLWRHAAEVVARRRVAATGTAGGSSESVSDGGGAAAAADWLWRRRLRLRGRHGVPPVCSGGGAVFAWRQRVARAAQLGGGASDWARRPRPWWRRRHNAVVRPQRRRIRRLDWASARLGRAQPKIE
ncbi:Os11g0449700 [Oryza sativa Japonica Group]|uniref:Os11g0449700 protein n=1 Tax=Oryza sativa subsp. japonica TaxID=39947 RepID=A0A0P0Y231_ORYSJ|nr:Os11g0449700 [Oryza sativa Japonica Group]